MMVYGHGVFASSKKIATTRKMSRTPVDGIEIANQNEASHPGSLALRFFMLIPQVLENRHFKKCEISCGVDLIAQPGAMRIPIQLSHIRLV